MQSLDFVMLCVMSLHSTFKFFSLLEVSLPPLQESEKGTEAALLLVGPESLQLLVGSGISEPEASQLEQGGRGHFQTALTQLHPGGRAKGKSPAGSRPKVCSSSCRALPHPLQFQHLQPLLLLFPPTSTSPISQRT